MQYYTHEHACRFTRTTHTHSACTLQFVMLMPTNAAFQSFGPIPADSLGDMLDYMMLVPGSAESVPTPASRKLLQTSLANERQVRACVCVSV